MNDTFMDETLVTLHPDTLMTGHLTIALQRVMDHYTSECPVASLAALVSAPAWRHNRADLVRGLAEREWLRDSNDKTALMCAEIQVMAIEAVASRWTPEQCRVQAVRIDGRLVTSLVCNMEGFTA